jgi:hypothetical protein
MLANAFIPITAIVLGYVIAVLAVVPSLVVEAIAIRFGTYVPHENAQPRQPSLRRAFGFAFLVNAASTIPGLITATVFVIEAPYIGMIAVHYLITVAIELPLLRLLGMRLTRNFVLIILGANLITYALMGGLVLLLA